MAIREVGSSVLKHFSGVGTVGLAGSLGAFSLGVVVMILSGRGGVLQPMDRRKYDQTRWFSSTRKDGDNVNNGIAFKMTCKRFEYILKFSIISVLC